MIRSIEEQCPLCSTDNAHRFHQDKKRTYLKCDCCMLVFVAISQRLGLNKEREQYDLHQNEVDDANYRDFLSRIYSPLTKILPPVVNVLDFGCGSGPALAAMFIEDGYKVDIYDPYFYPDLSIFKKQYQIITLTEVIEHLFHPLDELLRLKSMLSPAGLIGIMTKRLTDERKFSSWHYKNDPTHVCFYSDDTFQWIASRLGMTVDFCGSDSVILRG